MKNGIQYRMGGKTDVPKMVSLINSNYKRQKDDKYFIWQYFNDAVESGIVCAFDNGELIGMFGVLRREVIPDGLFGVQAIDLVVKKEWRGKGIFKTLGSIAEEYFKNTYLMFVLPNDNGKVACESSLSYRTLGKIKTYISGKFTDDKMPEYKIASLSKWSSIKTNAKNGSMMFGRSPNYMNWRFTNNPLYLYEIVEIKNGYFGIVKVFIDPATKDVCGDIVDFECPLKDQDSIRDVANSCRHYLFVKKRVQSVTAWAVPYAKLHDLFTQVGFVPADRERYFLIKPLKKISDGYFDLGNWHLVEADSEVY